MIVVTWLLHWTTAALVIAVLLTSLPLEVLEAFQATGLAWLRTHIGIGITILAITIARLCWKAIQASLHVKRRRSSSRISRYSQWYLLILLLALSVSGFLAFQQSPLALPVRMFGIRITPPLQLDHGLHMIFVSLHSWLAFAFPLLLALHIALAFRSQGSSNRMPIWLMLWPWRRRR
jgi:cytochrome b561